MKWPVGEGSPAGAYKSNHKTAVYAENLTGNEAASRGRQKADGFGDLRNGSEPTQGGIRFQSRQIVFGKAAEHIRHDAAGRNAVNSDARGTRFLCQRLGQADDRGL